jgi:hypothetical protein
VVDSISGLDWDSASLADEQLAETARSLLPEGPNQMTWGEGVASNILSSRRRLLHGIISNTVLPYVDRGS